ncbi:MAG: phosphatidylglycerophosphatase A [Thermodesulfobacteriota bacterium]|nr:phosphatidylglycerophosphatase A [Thermodesulfobacteriota bacterium]
MRRGFSNETDRQPVNKLNSIVHMWSNLGDRFILFVATGAFSGYFPVFPGTVGTLVGIGIYLLIYAFNPLFYIGILICLFFFAVLISAKGEKILHENDSSQIVIDEIFGFLVAMAFVPNRFVYIALGFFFFRLFDIIKVFPAGFFDKKIKNGYGVVLDDLVAGVYTNLVLHGLRFINF